jgi:hypothetical protein
MPAEGPRPWWDKALDPLRHEAAMFRVLLAVVVAVALLAVLVTVIRALT